MSRQCKTCGSPDRAEIERLQRDGVGILELERRYPPLTKDSLSRHFSGNHHTERVSTPTTAIYEELRTVTAAELFGAPDPSRADTVREREAIEAKRAVLTARREHLEALLSERLQSLQDRAIELEKRRDLLTYRRSEDELEQVERELGEATAAIHEIERGERGRRSDEAELARRAAKEREALDRRRLEEALERELDARRRLDRDIEPVLDALRAVLGSIDATHSAATRAGATSTPTGGSRVLLAGWLATKLAGALDPATVRYVGLRAPAPRHKLDRLAPAKPEATKPEPEAIATAQHEPRTSTAKEAS